MLQDFQTLFLINCGATEDVAKLLLLEESVRIIVVDSHRPFHHNFNNPQDINILALCNPADGTCDDVPQPDVLSGKQPRIHVQAGVSLPDLLHTGLSATQRWVVSSSFWLQQLRRALLVRTLKHMPV